jgi:hypothetical protein
MAPIHSSKAPLPDFRRIKAKVGKRAPKPANVTDTAFKSASVTVRQRTVAPPRAVPENLVSSRGHSILDFTTQLQHPAQAVRLSAAKGLKDLVHGSRRELLWNHLSLFVPAVAKCCVDAEEQVREVGLFIVKDLLAILDKHATTGLLPFAPLLMATLSCALNSLDTDMRRHGAMGVETLCQTVPRLVAPHVTELLPPFARLLSQESFFKTNRTKEIAEGTTKKRKRNPSKKSKGHEKDFSLANALLSLLSTTAAEDNIMDAELSIPCPSLVIVAKGRSRNALCLAGRSYSSHGIVSCDKLDDIAGFANQMLTQDAKHVNTKATLPLKTALDLMNSFRDALIEATQLGLASIHDKETMLLLCKSMRCFWDSWRGQFLSFDGKEGAQLEKTCKHIGKLVLEIFPLSTDGSGRELVDEVNAVMCATLFSLASSKNMQDKEVALWRKSVAAHVLSSLESLSQGDCAHSLDSQVHILGVLAELVLPSRREPAETKTRAKLVKAFCQAFFESERLTPALARSAVGRAAARLGHALYDASNFELSLVEQDLGPTALDIACVMPDYLLVWGGDFPSMSYVALSLLHQVGRRSTIEDAPLVGLVKTKLDALLVRGAAPPLLEQYSKAHQRLLVSLVVVLGSPSEHTMTHLGQICMRCRSNEEVCLPSDIAPFIVRSLHSIRKQLPLHTYLTFVMDSTGLDMCTDSVLQQDVQGSRPWKSMLAYDPAILEACCCFVDCGASKVLQMLTPLLKQWLTTGDAAGGLNNGDLVRSRAAGAMITLLSQELGGPLRNVLPDDINNSIIIQASAVLLCCAPTAGEVGYSDQLFHNWTRPLQALLSMDENLMSVLIQILCDKVTQLDSPAQTGTVAGMSKLLTKVDAVAPVVQRIHRSLLVQVCGLMERLPEGVSSVQEQLARLSANLSLIGEHRTVSHL